MPVAELRSALVQAGESLGQSLQGCWKHQGLTPMNVQARPSTWQARLIKSRDPRSKRFAVGRVESLEERVLLSTVTWVAKGSGNWNIAANWSTGAVPQAGASVVINKSSSVTVTLPASTSIGSLSLTAATLNITGGTLTVSGAVSNAGTLEVQPGAARRDRRQRNADGRRHVDIAGGRADDRCRDQSVDEHRVRVAVRDPGAPQRMAVLGHVRREYAVRPHRRAIARGIGTKLRCAAVVRGDSRRVVHGNGVRHDARRQSGSPARKAPSSRSCTTMPAAIC